MFGRKKKKKAVVRKEDKPTYHRDTGPNTHALLEAQRLGRGQGAPSHYLRKKKR